MALFGRQPIVDLAGSPAFPPVTRKITRVLKQVRIDRVFGVENRMKVAAPPQPPMELTGQNRVPRWCARRRRDERVLKQNSFFRNPIERGRFYDWIIVSTSVWPTPIISNAKQDVGFFRMLGQDLGWKQKQTKYEANKQVSDHDAPFET